MTESANGVVAGKVLKRDAQGHVHGTAEHREMILAEFERCFAPLSFRPNRKPISLPNKKS